MEFIKDLHGHSGCSIKLMRNSGCVFVRKQSQAVEYNDRLLRQCRKQAAYGEKVQVRVFVPEIYAEGFSDELFYFDMEYINGKSFAESLEAMPVNEIADYANTLIEGFEVRGSRISHHAKEAFAIKLRQVKPFCTDQIFREAYQVLISYDWENNMFRSQCCHGDLTLENIIVSTKNKLYFIDFLDSFYDSWMIDTAKLLQDLIIGWSYRKSSRQSSTLQLKQLIFYEHIVNELSKLTPNIESQLSAIMHILLLNILRILPYSADEITREFLLSACETVVEKISK